jgi:hypothetical protein
LTIGLFAWQIWRTEAVSKHLQEKGGGVLPLMAVVVLTIALVSCGIAIGEHAGPLSELVATGSSASLTQLVQDVPWAAVFWTALFSTDLLLLIEVAPFVSLFGCCRASDVYAALDGGNLLHVTV